MTPPKTNLERQKNRHIWPLVGIAVVVIFAVGIILFWLGEEVSDAPAPAENGVQSQEPPPATPGQGSAPAPQDQAPAPEAPAN